MLPTLKRYEVFASRERRPFVLEEGRKESTLGLSRLLSVPAVRRGEVVGRLVVAEAARPYTPADRRCLQVLAALWAVGAQEEAFLPRAAEQRLAGVFLRAGLLRRLVALSVLSSGAVHEIRQPVHAIKTLAEVSLFWLRREGKEAAVKVASNLEKIATQVARVEEIIESLRSFTTRKDKEETYCSLNEAVGQVADLLAAQFSSRGISLRIVLAPDLPHVALARTQAEEIVANLLHNSLRAHEETARSGKEVVVRTFREGLKVVLEVSDNACGFPEDLRRFLFRPFFTTRPGGTGLGLFVVRLLAEQCGGSVNCWNNREGGATFRVELPLAAGRNPEQEGEGEGC